MKHTSPRPLKTGPLTPLARRLKWSSTWPLHLMIMVPLAMLLLFEYVPMVGLSIAFQQYSPRKGIFGSEFVGLKHFKYLFALPDTGRVIRNTLVISISKICVTMILAVVIALLINELRYKRLGRITQSAALFPYYLSWVVLGGIITDVFGYTGLVNDVIEHFTGGRITILVSNVFFRPLLIGSHVWKEVGYNVIILMAAIAGIDETMYEAARIDGASRFQQNWYLTLPSLMPMITLLVVLALGGILSAGFDQVLALYSTPVYETSDILDTYIYRMGLLNGQYSLATAVGLFKSAVGMVLILISYWLAGKFAGYRVF